MKHIIGLILTFTFLNVWAEESNLTLSEAGQNRIQASRYSSAEKENLGLRFQLGQSQLELNNSASGSGLTLGMAYEFADLFAIGASYTDFKVSHAYYYSNFTSMRIGSAYAEIIPVQYEFSKVKFMGAIQMGSQTNFATTPEEGKRSDFFYGAALTASLNQQIGLSLDTKVSSEYKSMNSFSLIGYY